MPSKYGDSVHEEKPAPDVAERQYPSLGRTWTVMIALYIAMFLVALVSFISTAVLNKISNLNHTLRTKQSSLQQFLALQMNSTPCRISVGTALPT